MKIVLSWLADFIELAPGTTPQQIETALIQLGHEVDGIETHGNAFDNVVIGKILSREPHPNADKLGVCMVDVGGPVPRQIVCGAPNARAGLTVAVAVPGAALPGDFAIKSSKIRDVQSDGMLCSQRELGMGNEHNGIWEIDNSGAVIGAPLTSILPPPETVMDVAITPNRGDCFSHLGIARELSALKLGTLKPLPVFEPVTTPGTIHASSATPNCPQLNLLEVTGVTNGQSPAFVRQRLEAAGLRSKNALVDATNYVMLALGQPAHAYDAAKLSGTTITATSARGGEAFAGINDNTLTLGEDDVIITDSSGVIGLGGILGGASTAVTEATTRTVLEAASFDSVRIALSGQRHVLHTDARQRFERGVDPQLAAYALQYCAHLVADWTGGTLTAPVQAGAGMPAPQPIGYTPLFFTRFIGMEVAADMQREVLESLGFKVDEIGNNAADFEWLVTPPSYRTYMTTPEDLTEEILRVVGYENVPPQLPPGIGGQFAVNGAPVSLDRLARRAVAASGFLEVMTYSFIGDTIAQQFANGATTISLANPLAQTDMTTMRPSLLPGILNALSRNFANSDATPRLAEVGKTFSTKGEVLMAAGVLAATGTRNWQGESKKPDTFSAKAAAQQVLAILGAPIDSATVSTTVPAHYHPGRSGTLAIGPFTLATFGELHPALHKHYGFPASAGPIAIFEVHLEPLLKLQNKSRPWQASPYPPVARDLAFLLPKTVTAQQVTAAIQATRQPLLKGIEVFDHYAGDRIAADKYSLALSLTLQSAEKTLTEADINGVIEKAVDAVQSSLGGTLRT
ncbi:MAG: phenylalanine--tRNA ligase subunit beta [Alphaproteobacteria bacterium]|nr:MAG: phenylalanine--tRNA ligase subunit beta [Alphaproteobacteria bacterium]